MLGQKKIKRKNYSKRMRNSAKNKLKKWIKSWAQLILTFACDKFRPWIRDDRNRAPLHRTIFDWQIDPNHGCDAETMVRRLYCPYNREISHWSTLKLIWGLRLLCPNYRCHCHIRRKIHNQDYVTMSAIQYESNWHYCRWIFSTIWPMHQPNHFSTKI